MQKQRDGFLKHHTAFALKDSVSNKSNYNLLVITCKYAGMDKFELTWWIKQLQSR